MAKRERPHDRASVKTTVELPQHVWRAAKIRAMDDRVDLRTVLLRALESYLNLPDAGSASPRRAGRGPRAE